MLSLPCLPVSRVRSVLVHVPGPVRLVPELSRRVAVLRLVANVLTRRVSRLLPLGAQERPRMSRNVRRRVSRPLVLTALRMIVAKPEVMQTPPHVFTKLEAVLVAPLLPHALRLSPSRPLTVPEILV